MNLKALWPATVLLFIFSLIFGFIYPVFVTLMLHWICPYKANGSLVLIDHQVRGSRLLGQTFSSPHYFWGRASMNPNISQNNPALRLTIEKELSAFPSIPLIPIELVTTSGSGLDPDLSIEAALYQIERISKSRNLEPAILENLIYTSVIPPQAGFLGEPRINLLMLNIKLDKLKN